VWQLARFQLTRRIARSLGDSWASCSPPPFRRLPLLLRLCLTHSFPFSSFPFPLNRSRRFGEALKAARRAPRKITVNCNFPSKHIRFQRAIRMRGTSHGPVSVCLSQVGVLLKRLNVGSHKQHRTIAQGLLFSDAKDLREIRPGSPPTFLFLVTYRFNFVFIFRFHVVAAASASFRVHDELSTVVSCNRQSLFNTSCVF